MLKKQKNHLTNMIQRFINMAIKYIEDALDMPLNPSEKLVLIAIANFANKNGVAYPGYKTLVEKTGMGRECISKCLKVLKGAGIIKSESHAEIGKGKKVNTYTISLRSELTISSNLELIEKIKELRKDLSKPISSILELRKVRSSNSKSSILEHEPLFEPSVKQPLVKEKINKKEKSTKVVLPENFNVSEEVKTWYEKEKYSEPIEKHLEHFIDAVLANGYKYANWDSAFKNAIRGDWAKLRANGSKHQTAEDKRHERNIARNKEIWSNEF